MEPHTSEGNKCRYLSPAEWGNWGLSTQLFQKLHLPRSAGAQGFRSHTSGMMEI